MNPDVDAAEKPSTSTPTTLGRTRGVVVARNVGLNFISQFWFAVFAIATTPYIVRNLGVDSYGLYVIVSVVMGYFSFLDLGLGAALVKYISEYDAAGDARAVERVVRTGSGLYLVVGVFGAGTIALLAPVIVENVLTLPASEKDVARVAFYLAALGFLINMPAQTFSVVPVALQRFDVDRDPHDRLRDGLDRRHDRCPRRRLWPPRRPCCQPRRHRDDGYQLLPQDPHAATRRVLHAAYLSLSISVSCCDLGHSGPCNVSPRGSSFSSTGSSVSAFAPIAAVSYYAVPLSLSQQVTGLVNNVGAAVFPAASALAGQRDERRVEELYLRAMKLAALITLPIASIMFFYAHEIMRYWLSPAFELNSSQVLMILAVANLLFAGTTVPAVTLDATGRIKISTLFGLAAAAGNLLLVFTLVPTLGFRGAAWAVLGNAAIMVPMLLYYVHSHVLEIRLRDLFKRSLAKPLLAATVLWPLMIWARQYATSLLLLAALCVVTFVVYVGFTVILGAYDSRDRSLLRSFVRR